MSISKRGQRIADLADWGKRAGPKKKDHWRAGRSAMEAARAWLDARSPSLPCEIADLLASCAAFGPVLEWCGEPEARLRFDEYRGEPRNSDLVISARDVHGSFLLAVEAKADEPFAGTVGGTFAAAMGRRLKNPNSKGVARVERLASALFGAHAGDVPALGLLRYQLLTATAGALSEAGRRQQKRAVLLVHEFVTDQTKESKHARNARDLNSFVRCLSHGTVKEVVPGQIVGPFHVVGSESVPADVDLYVGKAVRRLRR